MIKIKSFRMPERKEGIVLALPIVWVRDLRLKAGDELSVYRDDLDRLIIVAPGAVVTGGAARDVRQAAPGRKRA